MESAPGTSTSLSSTTASRWPVWVLMLLLAAHFFGGLPAAARLDKYHIDEAYYGDGALQMRATGDVLTPRWSDGRPRFRKPIYTYWLVLAGFTVSGPGVLASRVPFLLLTAFVVWLTFLLALRLYGRLETAVLAAVILLSNLLFLDAAGHALPDTPLLVGITLSHFGFVNLLLLDRRSWRAYLCAYGGAGLAIGSKGLPGLLPVLWAVFFIVWVRRQRADSDAKPSFRTLWHGPAVAAGLAIGFWWYVVAYVQHGNAFLAGFFDDQIASKVEGSVWWVNLPTYAFFIVASFLPWVLLLVPRLRRFGEGWRSLSGAGRTFVFYALGFAVLVVLAYTPGNITYERYALPSVPLLAAALAGLLAPAPGATESPSPACIPWLGGAFRIVVPLVTLLVFGLLVLAHGQGLERFTRGCWMIVIGGAVAWSVARWRPGGAVVALGVYLMLFGFVYENQLRPLYRDSPAEEILRALEARGAREVVLLNGAKGLASQIRLISGGTVHVEDRRGEAYASGREGRLMVFPEGCRKRLVADGRAVVRLASRYDRVKFPKLATAFGEGRTADFLDEHREWYWLAEPKGPP